MGESVTIVVDDGQPWTAFSVVIPVFNMQATIQRCLDSVLSQSLQPKEVILVDDGSTDASIETAARSGIKVRVLRQLNQGAGAARNLGARAARSEWVAFLDADDAWLPMHLEELANVRYSHPQAKLVATAYSMSTGGTPQPEPYRFGSSRLCSYFAEVAKGKTVVWSSTAAVHVPSLLSVGGFSDHPRGQDVVAWTRLALRHPVAVSTSITAVYFRDPALVASKARSYQESLYASAAGSHQGTHRRLRHRTRIVAYAPAAQEVLLALSDGSHMRRRRDLEAFIDRATKNDLRYSLAVGDFQAVQQQRRMFLRPTRVANQPELLLAWMPEFVSRRAVALRRGVSRLTTRFRGTG